MATLDQNGLEQLKALTLEAGREVLEVYGQDFSVDIKEDKSPLTEADRRANAVIVKSLEEAFPGVPIISEETKEAAFDDRKDWSEFWLVDPLDGTKEFIKRNGEFTVNIALVRDGVPVAGCVGQPVADKLYWANEGCGAWRQEGDSEAVPLRGGEHYSSLQKVRVVASRSHLSQEVEDFVGELKAEGKEVDFLSSGSSLKLCMVAEGSADVYPRFGADHGVGYGSRSCDRSGVRAEGVGLSFFGATCLQQRESFESLVHR